MQILKLILSHQTQKWLLERSVELSNFYQNVFSQPCLTSLIEYLSIFSTTNNVQKLISNQTYIKEALK